jgi:hypothetical protein
MVMLFGSALPPFRPSLLVTLAILVLVPIECAVSSSPPILKHSATASSGVEYFGETFPEKQYSKRMRQLREETRGMFYHAYDNYRAHAFPWDELKPLSCEGRRWDRRDRGTLDDSLGGFSTTLVDALDMLALIGDYAGFREAVRTVIRTVSFNRNVNVSVFETNIRVLGGMLSAHMLLMDKDLGPILMQTRLSPREIAGEVAPFSYHGELLDMSLDLGNRLLPAFRTKTGLPSHMVNLKYGIPKSNSKEAKETCVAAAGTMMVEFGLLSRLTGVSTFETVARKAVLSLWKKRSTLDLLGSTINIDSGDWQASHASIGAGVDSFYEYLLKTYILFGDSSFLKMFESAYTAVDMHLIEEGGFYREAAMSSGAKRQRVMSSLAAFWPSLQVLKGDVNNAKKTIDAFYSVWQKFNAMPDLYNLDTNKLLHFGKDWPLRPELVESAYHLYVATRDPHYIDIAEHVFNTLQNSSRVDCGYASIADVTTHRLDDRMDSYFLSETTKYLFLIFHEAYTNPPHGNRFGHHSSSIEHGPRISSTAKVPLEPVKKKCVSWRQTGNCDGRGPRESQFDNDNCDVEIDTFKSGYCECQGDVRADPVDCDHAPLTCAQVCEELLAANSRGRKQAIIEPLPVDFSNAVFSTEGHLFILWSSLRPPRKQLKESTVSSPNAEEFEICPNVLPESPADTSNNPTVENIDYRQLALVSGFPGPSTPFLAKAKAINPESGLNLLAAALGEHIGTGGGMDINGDHSIHLECDHTGACKVPNDKLDGGFDLGHLLVSIQGSQENEREDVMHIQGSTAQFGPPLNSTHILGDIALSNPLDCCSALVDNDYRGAIVVAERGGCSFVEKAKFAQESGALGIVVMDKDETSFTDANGEQISVDKMEENQYFQMADDGNGKDIYIPSLLITTSQAKQILAEIEKHLTTSKIENGHQLILDMWGGDKKSVNTKMKKVTSQSFPLRAFSQIGLLPSDFIKTIKDAFSPQQLPTHSRGQTAFLQSVEVKTSGSGSGISNRQARGGSP